ncbi:helix-turn-helix domain-containing protein [Mycolicibacterium llatzerense]|uniref:helix-turn-helix domain-containing protein n=1 Tax=Mycolicibacterium llatzerense TaxID=280871 RepID=UPI0021B52947|nr:ImmA/IrrE family metallo-endopeptidase [Mycolicibacterium llatzerense]MCT7366349.1 hypothetical protein [Mycolicibacterium llatzerense]MCT7370907.1 hypothetical protein [Mycolicibacterium llatzerense]
MSHGDIGRRVAESIPAGITQGQLASQIGLSGEKLSKSLSGKRAFSSVELALLADVLDADLHWLITGKADPHRITVVARHDFDRETGARDVPGRGRDQSAIDGVELAYRQAMAAWAPADSALPTTVALVCDALGPDFIRPLASRIESALDVDVVRLPGLSTAYSFRIGSQNVIVVPATGNWFRENWDLAHELGHLVSRHHAEGNTLMHWGHCEAAANSFAADLLLPESRMREIDWDALTEAQLAELIWDWGVSTAALGTRLTSLNITVPEKLRAVLVMSTQKLLRWHWAGLQEDGRDAITERMDEAAMRRFPLRLQEAHTDLIAEGSLGKGTLAWMLGIDAETLEVDEPPLPEPVDADQLAAELGL